MLFRSFPLKPSEIKELLEDGDCRWTNRGAYDLLGGSDETMSPSKLPKAKTLYGSLSEQLKDPSSYASNLQKILKARKKYQINLATQVKILDVKNSSLFLAMYKLQNKSYLLVALNFSKEKLEEEFEIPQIQFKSAKNIITNKKEGKSFFSSKFTVKLDGLEAKAIVFKKREKSAQKKVVRMISRSAEGGRNKMAPKEQKDHDFSLSFVAGLVVGASLLLVLGAKKGGKLINKIKEEGGGAWDDFVEEHPQLAGKVADDAQKVRQSTGALASIGRSAKRFFKKSGKKLAN